MKAKTLLIELEYDGDHCGECIMLDTRTVGICRMFNELLGEHDGYLRCSECHAAEYTEEEKVKLMSTKRLTLKEGFLIVEYTIVPCHSCEVTTKDNWGIHQKNKLVIVDNISEVINSNANKVFQYRRDAIEELNKRKENHRKFCEKQAAYCQNIISTLP